MFCGGQFVEDCSDQLQELSNKVVGKWKKRGSGSAASMEGEFKKLLSRNDELTKQETTLKKEYSTLLRKISSLACVLEKVEPRVEAITAEEQARLISEKAVARAPALQWYNEQIALVQSLSEQGEDLPIPAELAESYKLSRDTPLLHRDLL